MGPSDVVVLAAGALGAGYLVGRARRLLRADRATAPTAPTVPSGTGSPSIAVVIPARDEAANLPGLLASLATQTRAPTEVVVVDDHSTDGTAAVARACGATVTSAPPLPDGWSGKAWACWTGAAATTSPVLVFLDADVVLAPDALARVEHAAASESATTLVSVQPFHTPVRPDEQLERAVQRRGVGGRPPRPSPEPQRVRTVPAHESGRLRGRGWPRPR